ncbi:MAG: phage tail protein [Marinifilaceae bacterium]|jgi:hypothetical protein|nr:phage tail protein [Marinifilaceae bacterium]
MKRQIQEKGIRKWYGDDFLDIQNELLKANEALYAPYGNCVISGCQVSDKTISEGIVFLNGKIMPFAGGQVDGFPVYLEASKIYQNREYKTGGSKKAIEIYTAELSAEQPDSPYILIDANGARSFRDAFQDTENRMPSDAQIASWNKAKKDVDQLPIEIRGESNLEETSPKWSLKKLYDWVVGGFITQSKISHAIDSDSEEHVASSRAVKELNEIKQSKIYTELNGNSETTDAQQPAYIILHEVYDGVTLPKSFVSGDIRARRGGKTSFSQQMRICIESETAYNSYSVKAFGMIHNLDLTIVTLNYNGKKCLAIKRQTNSTTFSFTFFGIQLNSILRLVDASEVTNVQHYSNISEFTNSGILLDDIIIR